MESFLLFWPLKEQRKCGWADLLGSPPRVWGPSQGSGRGDGSGYREGFCPRSRLQVCISPATTRSLSGRSRPDVSWWQDRPLWAEPTHPGPRRLQGRTGFCHSPRVFLRCSGVCAGIPAVCVSPGKHGNPRFHCASCGFTAGSLKSSPLTT